VKRLYAAPDLLVLPKGDRLASLMATSGLRPQKVATLKPGLVNLLCEDTSLVQACVTLLPVGTVGGHPLVGLGPNLPLAMKQLGLTLQTGDFPSGTQALTGAQARLPLSSSLTPLFLPSDKRSATPEAQTAHLVAGQLKPTGSALDGGIFVSMETARDILFQMSFTGHVNTEFTGRETGFLWVWLKSGVEPMERALKVSNQNSIYMAVPVREAVAEFAALTRTGRKVALLASALTLLLSLLACSTLLMARFDQMTQQLAVLRAIGKHPRELAAWVLAEGFLITLWGTGVGALMELALPAGWGMGQLVAGQAAVLPGLFPGLALVWGIVPLAGLLSGLPILWKVVRMDIHEALRTV
jgi:hypothetical protein